MGDFLEKLLDQRKRDKSEVKGSSSDGLSFDEVKKQSFGFGRRREIPKKAWLEAEVAGEREESF